MSLDYGLLSKGRFRVAATARAGLQGLTSQSDHWDGSVHVYLLRAMFNLGLTFGG